MIYVHGNYLVTVIHRLVKRLSLLEEFNTLQSQTINAPTAPKYS